MELAFWFRMKTVDGASEVDKSHVTVVLMFTLVFFCWRNSTARRVFGSQGYFCCYHHSSDEYLIFVQLRNISSDDSMRFMTTIASILCLPFVKFEVFVVDIKDLRIWILEKADSKKVVGQCIDL